MTGSNRRRSAWKADALPTELIPQNIAELRPRLCRIKTCWHDLIQETNCSTVASTHRALKYRQRTHRFGVSGGWWVRTTVGYCRQIYSLLPLAARATLRKYMIFQ